MRFVLLLLLLSSSASAQSVDARLDDLRLATAVRLALIENTETRGLDVEVTSDGGAVRLAGDGASNPRAVRVAEGVNGVRSVNGRRSAGAPAPTEARTPTPVRAAPPTPVSSDDGPPAAAPSGWGQAPAPRTEAPRGGAAEVFHWVERGDTLFSLANRYETSVETIRSLNGLGARDPIEVGQRLRVR